MRSSASRGPHVEGVGPMYLVAVVLRGWRLFSVTYALVVLGSAVVTLEQPRTYTSVALFMASGQDAVGARVSGLAAQLGLSLPSAPAGIGPADFVEIARSRQVLEFAASKRYRVTNGDTVREATLPELLGFSGRDPVISRERSVAWLGRQALTVFFDRESGSGLVSVEVRSSRPDLSQQLAAAVVAATDSATLASRRGQATATRQFVEGRLDTVRAELAAVESRVQQFLERNRDFQNSPQLTFDHDRLERELSLRQSLVLTLSGSFEQARIDEYRDTPGLRVLQPPTLPARPEPRRLALKLILSLLVGAVLSISAVFAVEWARAVAAADPGSTAQVRAYLADLSAAVGRALPHRRARG